LATSSLRRRAFWLKNFPNAEFSDIRGNIQTSLQNWKKEILMLPFYLWQELRE
jgi:hydroxymethylbilane synthase